MSYIENIKISGPVEPYTPLIGHLFLQTLEFFKMYCTYCLAEGTPVTLRNGLSVPIEDVIDMEDPWLLSNQGSHERGSLKPARLLQGIKIGRKETVEVWLEDGRKIECTEDHRVLTKKRGWIRADHLRGSEEEGEGECDSLHVSFSSPLLCPPSSLSSGLSTSFLVSLSLHRLVGLFLKSFDLTFLSRTFDWSLDAENLASDLRLVLGLEEGSVLVKEENNTFSINLANNASLDDLQKTLETTLDSLEHGLFDTQTSRELVAAYFGYSDPSALVDLLNKNETYDCQQVLPINVSNQRAANLLEIILNRLFEEEEGDDDEEKIKKKTLSPWATLFLVPLSSFTDKIGARFSSSLSMRLSVISSWERICQNTFSQCRCLSDGQSSSEPLLSSSLSAFSSLSQEELSNRSKVSPFLPSLSSFASRIGGLSWFSSPSSSSSSTSLPSLSLSVLCVRPSPTPSIVYDLTVDPDCSSFLANSVVVHNCDNQETAARCVQASKKRPEVDQYLKEVQKRCGNQTLSSFLILPVQRIPRYKLLLKELLKKTEDSHADYENLVEATNKLEGIAERVESSIKKAATYREFAAIYKKYTGIPVAPNRIFIEEAIFDVVRSDQALLGKKGGGKFTGLLLFNDIIGLIKDTLVVETLTLSLVWLDNLAKSPLAFTAGIAVDRSFQIQSPEGDYICMTSNKKAKQHWLEKINKAIQTEIEELSTENAVNLVEDQRPAKIDRARSFARLSSINNPSNSGATTARHSTVCDDGENSKLSSSGKVIVKLGSAFEQGIRIGSHTFVDERHYEGSWLNGKCHGQGKMSWPNGDTYEGEWAVSMCGMGKLVFNNGTFSIEGSFKGGMPDGIATYKGPSNLCYKGEWKGGKKHGRGHMTFPNGDTYEGEFEDNLFHGQGVYTSKHNGVYTGGWKNGKRHGFGEVVKEEYTYVGSWDCDMQAGIGKATMTSGSSYDGEWAFNTRHGSGTAIFSNGSCYEGMWVSNRREGEGKLKTKQGHVFMGTWVNGRLEGRAIWQTDKGHIFYNGHWSNGRFHGEGTYTGLDGSIYKGSWVNGIRQGEATWTCDSESFKGTFDDDQRNGKGTYTSQTGKYEGEWKDNKREGAGTFFLGPDCTRPLPPGDSWKNDLLVLGPNSHVPATNLYLFHSTPPPSPLWLGDLIDFSVLDDLM